MEQMKSNEDVLKVLLILIGIAIAYKVFLTIHKWCVLLSSESPITFYSGITLIVLTFSGLVFYFARKKYLALKEDLVITNGKAEDSVFAGYDERRKKIFINLSFRRMHAQVVGTTNAGASSSSTEKPTGSC
ncbi:MAG: hypothetical protein ACXWRU_18200 [Pseudobdellovibrionaceae bacterium]